MKVFYRKGPRCKDAKGDRRDQKKPRNLHYLERLERTSVTHQMQYNHRSEGEIGRTKGPIDEMRILLEALERWGTGSYETIEMGLR